MKDDQSWYSSPPESRINACKIRLHLLSLAFLFWNTTMVNPLEENNCLVVLLHRGSNSRSGKVAFASISLHGGHTSTCLLSGSSSKPLWSWELDVGPQHHSQQESAVWRGLVPLTSLGLSFLPSRHLLWLPWDVSSLMQACVYYLQLLPLFLLSFLKWWKWTLETLWEHLVEEPRST